MSSAPQGSSTGRDSSFPETADAERVSTSAWSVSAHAAANVGQGTQTLERRVQARRPLRTRVLVSLPENPAIEGRSSDISLSGMGLVTDVNVRAGVPCHLEFVLRFNDETTFTAEVSAKIAYCILGNDMNGFKIGAQFVGITTQTNAALLRYLKG